MLLRYPCWGYIHSAEHILSHDVGFGSYFSPCLLAVYAEEVGDMVLMKKKAKKRGNKTKKVYLSLIGYCAPVGKWEDEKITRQSTIAGSNCRVEPEGWSILVRES